nr:AMP-binding protein [uncultured bacterium]
MTGSSGSASVFDAIRRAGLLDPTALAALTAAAAVWGPTTAAPYAAAAVRHPNRTAVIDDYGSITFRQLEWRTTRLAGGLRSVGVGRGDAIGLLCRNHRAFVETTIAAAKIGARTVFLNTGLPASQLTEVIAREAIGVVIADADLADQLIVASTTRVVIAAPEADPRWSFPDIPRWRPLVQLPRPLGGAEPVVLTSGTTGAPKGTRRSIRPGASIAALGFVEAIPYERGDVFALPAPLFHAWGLSQMVLAATLAGTIVLRRSFDPDDVAADIEVHGATVLAAVPVMLHRILESAGTETSDLSSLRVVATSGSALPGDLALRWMNRHGDTLYNLYGSTEVGQVSVAAPTDLRQVPGTAGRPLRGIRLRIVDEQHSPVARNVVGQIVIESAMHFDGYTDGGNKTILDGFMVIGDQGHLDDEGRLFVSGRHDDMIISGGENLFPSNIERSLLSHAAVAEAVVVGPPDIDLGQRVRAVIVCDASMKQESTAALTKSIKDHLRHDLAGFEIPREFVYVADLPRNEAGKVLRRELVGPIRSIPHKRRGPDKPRSVKQKAKS